MGFYAEPGKQRHWGLLIYMLAASSSFRFLKMIRHLLGMKILRVTPCNAMSRSPSCSVSEGAKTAKELGQRRRTRGNAMHHLTKSSRATPSASATPCTRSRPRRVERGTKGQPSHPPADCFSRTLPPPHPTLGHSQTFADGTRDPHLPARDVCRLLRHPNLLRRVRPQRRRERSVVGGVWACSRRLSRVISRSACNGM